MITRIFHPIGQGAFYSERFEKINIVYDCGCGRDDFCEIGDKVVKQSFKSTDEIDILFISHFHSDHINGIETLKEHCKLIKNVVLPVLNDIEKILLISIYRALGLQEEADLIEDPDSYFGDDTKIIYVKQKGDKQEENNIDIELRDIEKIRKNEEIESGTPIGLSKISNWCFVPYNHEYIEKKGKLKEKLENKGIDLEKINERKSNHILCNFNKIEDVYKELFNYKELNENSMLLYSGPSEPLNHQYLLSFHWNYLFHDYYRQYYIAEDLNRVGCIYTGDADLHKVKINKIFGKYWNSVDTIQIPHHGSKTSFNGDFFDGKFYFCPISVGANNSYGHPSSEVCDFIFFNTALPFIINEFPAFGFIQTINQVV